MWPAHEHIAAVSADTDKHGLSSSVTHRRHHHTVAQ